MSTVYLVNLLRLTFNTPKKSSLLSPPLCSSNVRVCFHTMRSVSTVRNTFLKSSLSILFRLLHFPVPPSRVFHPCSLVPRLPVPRFPPLHFCYSRVFQSRVFSAPPRGGPLPLVAPLNKVKLTKVLCVRARRSHSLVRSSDLLFHFA